MFRTTLHKILRSSFFAGLLLLGAAGSGQNQQRVDHRIEVRLDDEDKELHGKESILYINRSGTALQCIYFHIWPEAYSGPNTALSKQKREHGDLSLYYASDEERGGIDSLDFKVEGERVPFYRNDQHPDIGHILLEDPLQPGDSLRISTPFRVDIPDAKFSRMGAKGDAFKIAQWYPKPAVYDEDGWHQMPYLDQGEFYNEFGSYEVSITLPKNYTVGATGKLSGKSGERERLDRLARETAEMDSFPDPKGAPASSEEMKTLHYRADSVTDFAWFADKRYRVLQERVPLPRSDRTVLARVFFTDHEADRWEHSMDYLEDALYYYSLWVGPYPHERISVVSSRSGLGGGMEYPGVTVIGPTNTGLQLERVIAHEVGHNWFQATLATNEREDPWMDEGLNSYYENRYMRVQHPDLAPFEGSIPRPLLRSMGIEDQDPMYKHYLQYRLVAAQEGDQPLSAPAPEFKQNNYASIVYSKGALFFDYLEEYLGTEKLDRAIRNYWSDHRFTHPDPEDLRHAFSEVTDKELAPFFQDFLHSTGKIDMKLKDVETVGGFRFGQQYRVTLKNEGDIAAPFPLTVIQADTMVEERWIEGTEGERTIELPYHTGQVKAFATDGKERIPDIDRRNDRHVTRTFFPEQEGLSLQPFIGLGDGHREELYPFPAVGWNAHDGFMSGLGIHDQALLAEPFDLALAPMYAWKSARITGLGSLGWNGWWDESPILDHARLQLAFRRFSIRSGYYERVAPSLEFWYEKGSDRSPHRHKTIFEAPAIRSVAENGAGEGGSSLLESIELFYKLEQIWEKESSLLPMEGELQGVHHESFTRVSGRWEGSFRYNDRKDAFSLRLFGGKFLRSGHSNPAYNFRMDGRGPGTDFLKGNYFFERGARDGIWSQQFARREGGFYVPTAHGSSNDWIASAGLEADLPFPEWPDLSLFFNQGWSAESSTDKLRSLYEGGVSVELLDEIVSIHLPLLFSPAIEDEHEVNGIGTAERIRFQLRLDRLDLFERLRTHSL